MRPLLVAALAVCAVCTPTPRDSNSTPCDQLSAIDWKAKTGTCDTTRLTFSIKTCSSIPSICTSSDQLALGAGASCLSNLPACQQDQEDAWNSFPAPHRRIDVAPHVAHNV